MRRVGKMVGSGVLVALVACTGGASNPAVTLTSSPAPTPTSTPEPATTPLEGTWVSMLDVRSLERRGFSAEQVHSLQRHDRWSSRQVNEIKVEGDAWVLWQGRDGRAPKSTGDFGQISVAPERIRLDEGVCFLTLRYRLDGDEVQITLANSTCDDVPSEPIPDFMYAAVFGGSYHRVG